MSASKPSKSVKNGKDPSVVAAEKRCAKAHSNLLSFQKTIVEIIEAKDWEVLGYENFDKYWVDRFSDITLAVEIWPHVVYELLREGGSIDSVAAAVKGVGPEEAANLKRQMDSGVPPGQAGAKRKPRRKGGNDATVFVHPGPERKARWEAAAASLDMSLTEFVIAAVDAAC